MAELSRHQRGIEPAGFSDRPQCLGKIESAGCFPVFKRPGQSRGGLQKAIADRGGITKIRCLAARQDPKSKIALTLTENDSHQPPVNWKYEIVISQQTRGQRLPILSSEQVWKNGQCILERPNTEDRADPPQLTQTYLEQINTNQSFREIPFFFQSIDYIHLIPQLIRDQSNSNHNSISSSDAYGRGFLERLMHTKEKKRQARLSRIGKALKFAVPQLGDLKAELDAAGHPHLLAKYEHWRPDGAWQNEGDFSDGTIRLIGIFWTLLDNEAPLLLEEPELSLNPAIVKHLVDCPSEI